MKRLALLFLVISGCVVRGPLVDAAHRGDAVTLRRELPPRLGAGTLGRKEARAVALATLDHELAVARGEDAVHRVLESEACVHDAASALRRRSHEKDAAAAEALVVLFEGGEISHGTALDHDDDPNPAFRRVAVRALDQPGDHEARVRYFTHSDGALRAMALRAAMVAGDSRDVPALLERARLEPDADARSNAVRALALLDEPPDDLAAFLGTLVPTADKSLRGDIAVAWALDPVYAHGGREALLHTLASDKLDPEERATIALLLLRTQAKDGALRGTAEALLVRALADDPVPVRLQIVRGAPQTPKLLEAIVVLAKSEEGTELGIAAQAYLLNGAAPERDAARARLLGLAGKDGGLGSKARLALAEAGDHRVQAWLEHDLAGPDPVRKTLALRGLAALGVAGRAAPLLADPAPTVRLRAACAILTERK